MTKNDILKQCIVENNIVKLPNVLLDRKLYLEVANSLNLIGGKWKGGKICGFIFSNDPTELLKKIQDGNKINLKKEFQFFETPEELANNIVQLAELNNNCSILEPSAGQGAIIKAIQQVVNIPIDCFELMDINRHVLEKINNVRIIGSDFLQFADSVIKNKNRFTLYDRIVANPPFCKNQDIDHIYGMYNCLKEKGVLVSISSKHWQLSNNKKETKFKNWLSDVNADIFEVDGGTFKKSGTMISSLIIKIRK